MYFSSRKLRAGALDEEARRLLADLARDPPAFVHGRRSRSEELLPILGSNQDGPREDALLGLDGAAELFGELSEECSEILNRAVSSWSEDGILPGELAALGPLLEMRGRAGVTINAERVVAWREEFERTIGLPQRRRKLSERYLANALRAFGLLEGFHSPERL